MKRQLAISTLSLTVSALLLCRHAVAFERQWHAGGGIGVRAYPHDYSAGPALGLNAAYGISDVFDLKCEVLGSYHGYSPDPRRPSQSAAPYSIIAGLSYKLDVLQWIPYLAVLAGFQYVAGALPTTRTVHRADALGAVVLGLDYALNRNWGLGASVRADMQFSSLSQGVAVTPMLRAEYHWGF